MKRAICLILAVVMLASLLLAIVPAVSAAGFGRHHQKKAEQTCTFVDADKDGICDHHGERCTAAEENGVCDTRAENSCGRAQPRDCPRQQRTEGHHGMGHGCGRK